MDGLSALAASCAQLDRMEEARAAADQILRLQPEFSISTMKLLLAAAAPDCTERMLDGLRKAGLP